MQWERIEAPAPYEVFPRLRELGVNHGFAVRQPGVSTRSDRALALQGLRPVHREILSAAWSSPRQFHTAEQVHGNAIAVARGDSICHEGADALVTADPSVGLGIYTADCCAVFLWDLRRRAIGLVHSGAKGTALGIVPRTIQAMGLQFGCDPGELVAVLSPCIRPPRYEVDFAAEIRAQCFRAGLREVWDGGECTGGDLRRFYSYRMEQGLTGRMLGFLSL
jgi:hypothetical protein